MPLSPDSPPPVPDESAEPARVATETPVSSADLGEGDVINNRYRVGRKLGHGGMGSVFLVEDMWRENHPLALKRVRKDRLDARTITILRNEFLALSPLSHPNLARVYDFEMDLITKDYFFTSEYVDGVQLLKAARDFRIGREGDFRRFLTMLVQILRALEFIHSRGLVHGDIKPENILISGSLCESPNGGSGGEKECPPVVKMIDFGLTKREKEFGGKRILGTTYYIAPETILGSQVDRRTDLYSLGVVLYHIVTRKLPFTGDSSMAVLRGHIEKTPNPPNVVEPAVPEALSKMILRLMEKQPANRFSSALEMIEALNGAFGVQFPLETPQTRLSYVQSGGFIAREQEMSELAALFETVYHLESQVEADEELNLPATIPVAFSGEVPPPPRGRMILIRGEEGVGKRRLLREFRRYVQTHGVHYLEIDCGGGEEGPQRSFAELILAQVGLLSARSPEEMPDQARLLAFLERIEKDQSELPLTLRPAVEKLAYKLLKLSRETPMVLAFTDFQRADAVLLEFLRAFIGLVTSGMVPNSQVVAVATAEDEIEHGRLRPFLAANNFRALIRELALSRFTFEEVGRLVASAFGAGGPGGKGPFSDRHIRLIYEESDGNPGVVAEILESLVQSDRLRRTTSGWVCEGLIDRDTVPGKVRRELRARIERLDSSALRLGSALALLGSSGELEVAVRLGGIPPGTIIDAILALRQAKIIREEPGDGGSTRYSFVHQSARDILYEFIPEKERGAGHDRAGLLLEEHLSASGQKDPRRLTFHFLRAGNAAAALRYGMDAAREYAAQHLPLKAIEVYVGLRRFALPDDLPLARRIDREIARIHFQVGEYRPAAEILQRLSGWSSGSAEQSPEVMEEKERASALVELGEALCRLANFRDAFGCFHEAFRLLKNSGSTRELATLLLGFAELYHKKGNFPESLRYCERVLGWEKNLQALPLEARLYLLLAENHFRLDNKEIAARYCQKGLELLTSKRDVDHMALTLHFLGRFYTYKGRFQKALKNLQQCAVVNQKMNTVDRQADCLREMGAIFLLMNRPQEARTHLDHAISLYDRTENLAHAIEALNLRGEALRILGYYDDAQKDLQRALHLNAGVASVQNAAESLLTLGKISLDHGQLKRAEKYFAEAERSKDGQLDDRAPINFLVVRCGMEMMRGQFSEALDLAARATIAGRESGNRLRIAPHLDLLVRLYLAVGKCAEARRSVAALVEIAERYGLPVLEGRSFLLEGMLLAAEGRTEGAGKVFNRALEIFREERSERDLVSTYLEFGRLQLSLKSHEQAYLLFEEGLYLAKKLNLIHARCQFHHLMALQEKDMPEGVFTRTVGYFLSAEKAAQAGPFPDLLWRIRRDLGQFYLEHSRIPSADRTLAAAVEARREQLERMPEDFRESYLAAARCGDLDELAAEARARADSQSRKEKVKYPPRNPERDEYFGLVGRCPPMRELFRSLAALPAEVPWVWVWGAPGSGRREVARVIHRQSVPDREALWVQPGAALKGAEWDRFLSELEKARAAGGLPPGVKGEAQKSVDFPGRFTLVVCDLPELPPENQQVLLARVTSEKGRSDGLRVIATLDRAMENFQGEVPPDAKGRIIPELLKQEFPSIRVPLLSERAEDYPLLITHFLLAGRPKDTPVPMLSDEAIEAVRQLTIRDQVRELRDLCEKIRRMGSTSQVIEVEGIRTIITPTLRIARRK